MVVNVHLRHGNATLLFADGLLQPGPKDLTGATPPVNQYSVSHTNIGWALDVFSLIKVLIGKRMEIFTTALQCQQDMHPVTDPP